MKQLILIRNKMPSPGTLAGDREFMLKYYRYAVEEKYRFFSFGDAMFLL